MKRIALFLLFTCCIFLVGCLANAAPVQGRVLSIADGDTFTVMLRGQKIKVRIHGIDAPERNMPYYKASKSYLSGLIGNRQVLLTLVEKDRYGRWVARVQLPDKTDVGAQMVAAGMAWHFTRYSADRKLAALQQKAKVAKLGLWRDPKPMPPWVVRKARRN